jgi:hypothetical protein
MKLNIDRNILTLQGKCFQQPSPDGSKLVESPCTLQEAMFAALTSQLQSDAAFNLDQKLKVHRLASKVVRASGVTAFTAEEIALVKERAAGLYGIHFFGQLVEALEGEEPPEDRAA